MASYEQLAGIKSDPLWNLLESKIKVACQKKASVIIGLDPPSAAQLEWATKCLSNPDSVVYVISNYVIASNSLLDITVILGASDGNIQTKVDEAVDKIAV